MLIQNQEDLKLYNIVLHVCYFLTGANIFIAPYLMKNINKNPRKLNTSTKAINFDEMADLEDKMLVFSSTMFHSTVATLTPKTRI